MKHFNDVVDKIDKAIIKSRMNSLTVMMMTDRADRVKRIKTVLQELPNGAYLIGTGPSTVGIIPLTVEEVVLGRAATPLETPADAVVDYEVGDAMYLGPHEVSRVHAKIRRTTDTSGTSTVIIDLDSQCGTYINGTRATSTDGDTLKHGDVIALGASHTSTYLFIEMDVDCDAGRGS
jgi:pSer/pThr/pTyr-binding forkhead associated (FHA) protein